MHKAITLILYIQTKVDAMSLTREEVVGSAIVTLAGKDVRVIRTTTITIADF